MAATLRKRSVDSSLDNVVLVDQLPSDAWAEGIVIRPSGHALATRIDGCELYSIDAAFETLGDDVAPRTLIKFPGANAVVNICRLTGTEDEEYAVISCHCEFAAARFTNVTVWRVSFDPDDDEAAPTVTKIADLPDCGFPLGLIPISDDTLAIADTSTPCILRVHIPTKKVSILLQDAPSMSAATDQELFGVNRIRVAGGYLWYTNTSSGILYRAPIEHVDNKRDIRVTGPPTQVADGLFHADGLTMLRDGSAAYISSYVLGNVWKVEIDPATGKGTPVVMLGDLVTPTAMDLVNKKSNEKPTLYVVCCGAVSQEMLDGDRGVALSQGANVDTSRFKILVTITTEISVTYEPAD